MSGHDEVRLGRLPREALIPVKGCDTPDTIAVRHGNTAEYISACVMQLACGRLIVEQGAQ